MRVALVSEGTYPYAMGGVSVWCDQLMRGLPEHTFEFVALTVDRSSRPLWEPPANLRTVHVIPLWTPQAPVRPVAGEAAAVADLIDQLVPALPDDAGAAATRVELFLDALRRLAACARSRGGTRGLFTNDRAVRRLGERWRAARDDELTLRAALTWSEMLEHLLRPLQEEPVRADVVHSAMNGPSMLVGMAAHWAHGTPVVLSEHGIYLRERYLLEEGDDTLDRAVRALRLGFFRLLASASYQVADAVAPHSRYNRRWQERCGADTSRMRTMYNGVDLESFPVAVDEPDPPTVCFLGRIDPVKDVRTLIRAFAVVHRALPTVRLRVFGGAPLGQEAYLRSCHELTHELGLADVVTFEGPTDHPSTAYHSGSVVALSSISEGFPYSVLEAMACGRPVVCTDVGGVAEAVGQAGLVVPPRDPEALGRGLLALLQDDDGRRRMGQEARRRVGAEFTVDRWTAAYADLYAEVTGRRAAGWSAPVPALPEAVLAS